MMYNGRERSKQGEKRGFYGFVALKDCTGRNTKILTTTKKDYVLVSPFAQGFQGLKCPYGLVHCFDRRP